MSTGMSGSNNTSPGPSLTLPSDLQEPLVRYRNRVWFIKAAEGLLSAVFGLLLSYLLVVGIDRLFDTPLVVRVALLVAGSVGMVLLFPLKLYYWVWCHRRLDQVARLVRQRLPRFGDHLLGVVELVRGTNQNSPSRPLVEAAVNQVARDMAGRDLSRAIPRPRHVLWAWMVGVLLFVLCVFIWWAPDAGFNAFVRWLTPWRLVERYTFAQLVSDRDSLVVPYGEPFEVVTRLRESSPWKPSEAVAQYGHQSAIAAELEASIYSFEFPPQTEDETVAIRVGDARHSLAVKPRLRPALNELSAEIELPSYLQRPEALVEDARGGRLTVLKGSVVKLRAKATRTLSEATLDGRVQSIDGESIASETMLVVGPSEHRLNWRDTLGLTPRDSQVLEIGIREDRAPNVTFTDFKNNLVVLPDEVVPMGIIASDDFGVRQVGIEWEGIKDPVMNPEPATGEKIVSGGRATLERLDVSGTFSAVREGVRPQSLKIRAYVEDSLPNRERVYSAPLRLHVLDPADHFQWLTEQMGQWADVAQEVYEKELELHERNEALRQLSPAALNTAEVKRQIQDQADAEEANAAKLGTLVDVGKELVQSAAKNQEFDARQLEDWAELLQELESMAQEKMPSIAELLAQAAASTASDEEPTRESSEPVDPSENSMSGEPGTEAEADESEAANGKPNLEKPEQYGPETKELKGLELSPDDPNTPGGGTNVDRGTPADGDPGFLPANPTPSAGDSESGFNESEKAVDAAQVKGGAGIPTSVLKGSGNPPEESEEESASSTTGLVLLAVKEQQSILDSFAKLAGEISELLMGFQNSTFVKRLKTASREQWDIASKLDALDGFGLSSEETETVSQRKRLADDQLFSSEQILTLQDDMAAYAARRPSEKYSGVLDEMLDSGVVTELESSSEAILQNAVGRSTIEAEFWSDTLDRWAEELVDPGQAPEGGGEGMYDEPSLTPEMILAVLRVIRDEVDLREETRELDQTRSLLEPSAYRSKALDLSADQAGLVVETRSILDLINELPDANHEVITMQKEKLSHAAEVMDEAASLLAKPETGAVTIAAITDVIEILLESSRVPNAPMIVKASPTSTPALLLIGLGDDAGRAQLEARAPEQATGRSGRKLPEEFRQGLDAYLNALERQAP